MDVISSRADDPPQLCEACAAMNFDALLQPDGYERLVVVRSLKKSECPMCKLIGEALFLTLSQDQTADAPKEEERPTTLRYRLAEKEGYQTALHIAIESPPKETYLSVFVSQSMADQASKHQLALKFDLAEHVLSGTTLFIIQKWIEQCIQMHKCDKPLSKNLPESFGFHSSINRQTLNPLNAMPTRLIHLNAHGADTWDCKLVDFQDGMVYSALTYCWGETQKYPCKTTTKSIESMRTRIEFEKLPNTLQHAVAIARAIELSYLWVDAICIYSYRTTMNYFRFLRFVPQKTEG